MSNELEKDLTEILRQHRVGVYPAQVSHKIQQTSVVNLRDFGIAMGEADVSHIYLESIEIDSYWGTYVIRFYPNTDQ